MAHTQATARYDGHVLGRAFLDGVLWASGARASRRKGRLRVSDLPAATMERLVAAFRAAGCHVEFTEAPNFVTKNLDAYLRLTSAEGRFDRLPAFRDRRLDPERHPAAFLDGALLAMAMPISPRERVGGRPAGDYMVRFHPHRGAGKPVDDVAQALASRGVGAFVPVGTSFVADQHAVRRIRPLAQMMAAFREEEADAAHRFDLPPDATTGAVEALLRHPKTAHLMRFADHIWECRRIALSWLGAATAKPGDQTPMPWPQRHRLAAGDHDVLVRSYFWRLWGPTLGPQGLAVEVGRLEELVRATEPALAAMFRLSDEHRELFDLVDEVAAEAHRWDADDTIGPALGWAADRESASLRRFFATFTLPEWFTRVGGALRFLPHEVRRAGRDPDALKARVGDRLDAYAVTAFRAFGGFRYTRPTGDVKLLEACAGCLGGQAPDGGAACVDCQRPLCLLCAAMQRTPPHPGRPPKNDWRAKPRCLAHFQGLLGWQGRFVREPEEERADGRIPVEQLLAGRTTNGRKTVIRRQDS